MTSQYVICQFGNMLTGEFLNIGVYTYDKDSDKVYNQFLTNWTRVNTAFGTTVRDPLFEAIVEDLKKIETKLELEETIGFSNSPYSSLQFAPPRASLNDAKELVEWAAKNFLIE